MEKEDVIIYKMIDEILWNDWDPIGINDIAPRDEYYMYIPSIFALKKTGASKEEIANQLYKIETERIGLVGSLENCLLVADKILGIN